MTTFKKGKLYVLNKENFLLDDLRHKKLNFGTIVDERYFHSKEYESKAGDVFMCISDGPATIRFEHEPSGYHQTMRGYKMLVADNLIFVLDSRWHMFERIS